MSSETSYSRDLYSSLAFMEYLGSFEEYDNEIVYSLINYDEPGIILGNNEPYNALNQDFLNEKELEYSRRLTGGSVFVCRPEDIHFAISVPREECSGMAEFFESTIAESIETSLEESGVDKSSLSTRKDDRSVRYDGLPISGSSNQRSNGRILYAGFISAEPWDEELLDSITALRSGEQEVIHELPSISELDSNVQHVSEQLEECLESYGFEHVDRKSSDEKLISEIAEKYESEEWLKTPIEASGGEKYRGFCPIMEEDLEQL